MGKDRSLYDVCSIFARINQKGLRLSTFDLMNAFLYPKGIALRKDFEDLNYEILKRIPGIDELLLKTMSLYKQDYCSSKYIYNLIPGQKVIQKVDGKKQEVILVKDAEEFKKLWRNSVKYCEKARKKIMNTGEYDFGSIKVDFIPNTTTIPVIGPFNVSGFIGEAKIKRVVLSEDPMKLYETYSNRIFLTKEELREYIKSQERWKSGWKSRGQQKKLWMAIELEDIKKYDKPIKPKRFVPDCGQYLRE